MRIRADENVSPRLVDAVSNIALSNGWELTHVRQVGDQGASDVHWITNFASEGGDAILTADADFVRKRPQKAAVAALGIRVVRLHKSFGNARGNLQAAHVLFWWPKIEKTLESMAPGTACEVPWNFRNTHIPIVQQRRRRGSARAENT